MRAPAAASIFAAALLTASPAHAGSTVRYALIVGNNVGRSSEVQLEPLRHAEREAQQVRDRIVRYANFDESRVELVLGGSRQALLAAAARLAERRSRDVQELGPLPSLFAFFFTGHGLSGKLLTAGEPLDGKDISAIVKQVGATLTVGIFDACYSGSLDWEALKGKGAVSTPGFNPIAELPSEILDSEGTMWFVSSRPEELSYEDEALGGLFSHFFSEAFTEAPVDGVGITLDAMWEFARRRTAAHAARYGRSQTPEKIIRNLKARGPLYFSFPQRRSAALRFHPELEGTFLLTYEQSALVERVVKSKGAPLEVAVYDGEVQLQRLDGGGRSSRHLSLKPGQTLSLQPETAALAAHAPGFGESPIRGKGELVGVVATAPVTRSLATLGAGYRFADPGTNLLGAAHSGSVELGFWRGPLSLSLSLGLGRGEEIHSAWTAAVGELSLRPRIGYGFDFRRLRLDLEAEGGLGGQWVSYSSGASRAAACYLAAAGLRLSVPVAAFPGEPVLFARTGYVARWAEGIAAGDRALHLGLGPSLEVGIAIPLFGE